MRYLRFLFVLLALAAGLSPARAIESVRVPIESQAIDLTKAFETYHSDGDRLVVSTAPGSDGIVRRIEVRARDEGTRPDWIVFALTNDTSEQIERLLVAPHFRLVGSGVIWPDLGASRISAITASQGFPIERDESADADVFRLTLDPGTTVTYVAELRTPNLPQLYLWEPDAYKDKMTSLALYKGIVIGVAGLLALFLTIVFVVKGAVIFPAAAALAWTVLAYVCIDFGFWSKIFGTEGQSDRVWRACVETTLSATLLVFLFAYLKLNRWHVRASHVAAAWLIFLAALAGLALYDAPVAAGVARISLATIAGAGFVLVLYLAMHGYDRAIMLIPTWLLLLIWVIGAAFTVTGTLTNDLVSPALVGGLVLIVMLIGFTIMQNAFAGSALGTGGLSETERKALALTGSGDVIFDWDVAADRVYVSPEVEVQLGLARGALEGPAAAWLDVLHPTERDRFRACLDTMLEQRRGRINQEFRLRADGADYYWFRMKARPVVGTDGEVVRIVGTLVDITEAKIAEERLLHDAVHDNLTGLPNRELFFDRVDAVLTLAQTDNRIRPAIISIDIDRFKQINEAAGLSAADSILLTLARRLARILKPRDTLARLSGDQFAVLIVSEFETAQISAFANLVRRVVSTPVTVQRQGNSAHRLDRSRALRSAIARDARRHAEGCRNRDAAWQAHGRQSHRSVQAVDAHAALGSFRSRRGLAPRARPRRNQGSVPTDRPARGPHGRGLRSVAPMGSSASGAARPRRIHSSRRGDRDDYRSRDFRAGAHRARTFRLATRARRRSADFRQRQCLLAPIAPPRSPA